MMQSLNSDYGLYYSFRELLHGSKTVQVTDYRRSSLGLSKGGGMNATYQYIWGDYLPAVHGV